MQNSNLYETNKTNIARPNPKRHKANARERNRMHGLNRALDELRLRIPLGGGSGLAHQQAQQYQMQQQQQEQQLPSIHHRGHKLSKIETLRLARNYLVLLTEMVSHNQVYDDLVIGQILSYRMGQQSLNQLAVLLNIDGSTRILSKPSPQVQQIFAKYDC